MMKGLKTAGTALIDPTTGLPTTFEVPGDPIAHTGWYDASPGDRRFMVSMGPFTMEPGDTSRLVAAVIAARGADRLESVRNMTLLARLAKAHYDGRDGGLLATDFEAAEDEDGVVLTWTHPAREDICEIVVRYSTMTYPGNPAEGISMPDESGGLIHAEVIAGRTYYYSAFARLDDGSYILFGLDEVTPQASSGVPRPGTGCLERAVTLKVEPNPATGAVKIVCSLGKTADTDVSVFSISGRLVRTLAKGISSPGRTEVTWDGRNETGDRVPAGIYLVRLHAGEASATGKVVILD
jgi:hypothetical protein